MSSFKADISNNVPKPNQAKKVIVLTNNNEIFFTLLLPAQLTTSF